MLGLDGGNAGGVHAAHLAGTDTDGLAALGIDDGIGLHVLGDLPGKDQVVDFRFGRRTPGDDLEVGVLDHAQVLVLHQQAAGHALEVPLRGAGVDGRQCAAFQHAHVLLGGGDLQRGLRDARRNNHFHKLALDDGLRGLGVQLAVEGDDAAEGGFGVGGIGQVIGLADAAFVVRHHGHAAGIGVLDDDAGWLGEALHALQRGVGVGDVVVAEFLALQLARGGDGSLLRGGLGVEGGALVGVLAVAQVLGLEELGVEGARKNLAERQVALLFTLFIGNQAAQVVGDHAVVAGGVFEGLHGEVKAGLVGEAAGRLDLGQHRAVIGGIDYDADVGVVLGGRAHHGRAADVDVLDGIGQGAVGLGHGGGEGVEVDHHEVDAGNAVLGHHGIVLAAAAKDAAVDLGMQRLHAAVHHLRETGVVGDFGHRDAAVAQQLEGAAGGQQRDACLAEFAGEVDDAGLVGDGDQGLFDGLAHGATHRWLEILSGALVHRDPQIKKGARALFRLSCVLLTSARGP